MFPSTKNSTQFWYSKNVKGEVNSFYPIGSYPKPQISDLVVLAAYPFGSILSSVSKGDGKYRYSFNGMEKDNELKGEGNSLDFGARIYDSRLGRWMSVDPLARLQPSWSVYKSFKDNPIIYNDPDGRIETIRTITYDPANKKTTIEVTYANKVMTDGAAVDVYHWTGDYQVNKYYDFETTITKEIVNGKAVVRDTKHEIITENGIKKTETIWTSSEKKGHTITEVTWIKSFYTKVKEFSSYGITVYGSGESTKYRRNGVSIASLDLKELEEILSVLLVVSGGKTNSTPTLPDMTEKVKEVIKTEHEKKEKMMTDTKDEPATTSDSIECIRCGRTIHKKTKLGEGDNPNYKGHKAE
jgi:RHS repeat-associated protein